MIADPFDWYTRVVPSEHIGFGVFFLVNVLLVQYKLEGVGGREREGESSRELELERAGER